MNNSHGLDEIIANLISNMVQVDGGTFMMGSLSNLDENSSFYREFPIHKVTVSSFYIGRYEVTQEEWEAIMHSHPSRFKGAKLPVEMVSWEECQIFIQNLNNITGKMFRLPTEAEWEFAARGGNCSKGYKYSGSNIVDSVAWYKGNSGGETHPVGQKSPNELGLYDMSGNVWEWCSDWVGEYNNSSLQVNPIGMPSGLKRVNRGGSWRYQSDYCCVFLRGNHPPIVKNCNLGFRLVSSAL